MVNTNVVSNHEASCQKIGGSQAQWAWQPHLNIKSIVGGSNQKSFDYHIFNIGYNATKIFYSTTKAAKGSGGLPPQKNFHNYILYNVGECPIANIIRKLQPIIFGIEKTITRYPLITIERYELAIAGKILELWGTAPQATLWLHGW